jgi:hypothetical protein
MHESRRRPVLAANEWQGMGKADRENGQGDGWSERFIRVAEMCTQISATHMASERGHWGQTASDEGMQP